MTSAEPTDQPERSCNCKHDIRLDEQLELAVASRIGEDQITWLIFSVFAAAQIVLVGSYADLERVCSLRGLLFSLVGASTSLVWYYVQDRALQHLERFEAIIEHLENSLGRDPKQLPPEDLKADPKQISRWLTQVGRFPGWGARDVVRIGSYLSAISWILMFAIIAVETLQQSKANSPMGFLFGFAAGAATLIAATTIACGVSGVKRLTFWSHRR